MKKRLFAMFLMLTALGGASCQDDTTESDPAVVLNPPTLTATPDEVVITGSETSSVLELEWSPAAQTENVTYTLEDGVVYAFSECVCEENIAEEVPISAGE